MKITRITIKDFLRLKDVDFNPSHTNVIVGKNKQGKTSILKAIQTALEGKADASSIRIGEDKAEITIEMDGMQVRRSITDKGSHLSISNTEGMTYPAPQKFLDGILGTFSFNPISFFEKKATERKKYLLDAVKMTLTQDELAVYTGEKLAGLDYSEHALVVVEQARKYYYDKRTAANAEETKKTKALADLNDNIPADFDPKKVSDEEITKLREAITKDEVEKAKMDANKEAILELQKRETALHAELAQVEKDIVEKLALKFDVSDDMALGAAKDTLKALEGQKEVLYTVKRRDEVRGELDTAKQEADRLDGVVKALSNQVPADLIAKASLPVEGLTIEGDEILIKGVNIDNLSHSEQIKFGLDVVRALNGEFKVICVDGVEALDKESFEAFLKEVENDDYQYFVTRVDGASEHSIVVEDGEIKK